ncbi:hypothetical protein GCM10027586_16070 [Kineococcus gypseus]|uniref:hypothetical protein n=1 Tax=Kineococcus gypseus TaxID=1637102 RepID=UPI003D7DAFA9
MTTRIPEPKPWLVLAPCLASLAVLLLVTSTDPGPLQAALALVVAGAGGYLGGLAIRSRRRHTQTLQRDQEVLDGLEPLGGPDRGSSR